MAQNTKAQVFQVLDNFISTENQNMGTKFYRDKKGNDGPEDVVFTDDTLNDMAISINVKEDDDPESENIIFFYQKKFRKLAKQLKDKLLVDLGLVFQIEDFS